MPRRRTFLLPGSPLCAHIQHIFSSHPRISCGRRGTAPPVHSGATHPCTNSAARAAGGESPPLRAHLGDPHPAQVPQLERPRRAHPLSQSHMLNVTLDFNIPVCSESRWPASSYARAFTHSRRIPHTPTRPPRAAGSRAVKRPPTCRIHSRAKNCLSLSLRHAWRTRKQMVAADQNTLLDMSLGIFIFSFFYPVMPSSMATRVLPSTHTPSYHL